ncbi:LytTR family DNA-binding domain-containing protein [Phenylobacterium sp. VNQ135]|uniref:LytTR family DNA-binding domain-containing protein n=1 Tax=Phenylobacterium sp. VNQ135 TaxID=3400922 RepID=UPI003C0B5D70
MSGGVAGMSGRRRDALFVAGVLVIGAAIAIVDALSVTHDLSQAGRPIPLWEPLVWEFTSVTMLVMLTPLVQVLTRRATPMQSPWRLAIPLHLAGALVFSLAHVTGMGVLRWAIYLGVDQVYQPFGPLSEFLYEFRKDILVYVALVGLYALWMRLAPGRTTSAAAAVLEVKDGARRIFVPVAEIVIVEAAGNYVELHRVGQPVLHRASLADMERELAGAGFVRIHRSRLVRRDAVSRVESRSSGDFLVRLSDGREVAGSRRYRRPLLEP